MSDTPKDPAAVALGRKGGLAAAGKGGKARAAKMTPEQRSESARKAALARWPNMCNCGACPKCKARAAKRRSRARRDGNERKTADI